MFLELGHTKLNVFQETKKLTLECYKLTKLFPEDEKFAMVSQIRRAALSVHLNLAEGASRKSTNERKRYFEISRGSLIEVDTALDIAVELGYILPENIADLGLMIVKAFKLLSGLITQSNQDSLTHN